MVTSIKGVVFKQGNVVFSALKGIYNAKIIFFIIAYLLLLMVYMLRKFEFEFSMLSLLRY